MMYVYSKRDIFNKIKEDVIRIEHYIDEDKNIKAKIIVKDIHVYNKIAQLAISASDAERLVLIKFVNEISTIHDLGIVRRKEETVLQERKALCFIIKCCESDKIKLGLIKNLANKIQNPQYKAYLISSIKSEKLKNQEWENNPEIHDQIDEIKGVQLLLEQYFVSGISSDQIKNDITVTEEIEQLLKKCENLKSQITAKLKEENKEEPSGWGEDGK